MTAAFIYLGFDQGRRRNNILYTNEPWFDFKVSTPYADPPMRTYKQTDPWPVSVIGFLLAQHYWDNILGHEELYNELDGYISFAKGAV